MTHISKCEHGVYMALCRKCFPGQVDVEFNKDDYCSPQLKTLTDEEILKEMEFLPSSIAITDEDLIQFAKAILRKAQE
jgi:hypothetical protein